ncbi:MAG: hypothetical protein NC236_02990 [Mycoplasma sp.]|nr:hypothetical protein [Mycoplasma sp.]
MVSIGEWLESWNNTGTMWIWFIPVALGTLFFALKLVAYAEKMIQVTKLAGAFVGLVFVSIVTSFPEFITEISQGLAKEPSIGVSDDIGANAFSIAMLAVASLVFIKSMFVKNLSWWTKTTIGLAFGITLIMTFVFYFGFDISIGHVGEYSIGLVPILLVVFYVLFTIVAYIFRNNGEPEPELTEKITMSKNRVFALFGIFALCLITFSLLLNWVIDGIQKTYSIDTKSAGGLLLSMTTAMPETVALFKFGKSGYLGAAAGSIIGSHLFNLSAIFWGDLAYSDDALILVRNVQEIWAIAAMTAIMLGLFFAFTLVGKKIKNKFYYSIIPTIIVLVYFIGWILILTKVI